MNYIDCHVHIGKTEKTRYYYTFESYRELMKENGIDKAVIFPNVSSVEPANALNNRFLSDKNLDRALFYPFLLVDPRFSPALLMQINEKEISGVKFHPSITGYTACSKQMNSFWECCRAKKIPALVHCGRHEISHIRYLILAAKTFPQVNFIGAHLGGNATELVDAALTLLSEEKPVDNIYLDTSGVNLPGLIERAVSVMGEDKILFGSDVPYQDLRIGKVCIELADIEAVVKEKIFYGNVRGLLDC